MVNVINMLLREAIETPTGLWPKIYTAIESFVGNYGWTIFLFTLFVKLIVFPLDIYNRYSSRKNNFIQKRLSGQVQKIQEKNKNNQNLANQQVSALYKREGYNMVGTCVFTLVNLVVTLVLFFSFFSSLKTISSYKMLDQYYILEQTYEQTEGTEEEKQIAVVNKYNEIEDADTWLWVKNIWRKDSKESVIPTYSELKETIKSNEKKYAKYFDEQHEEKDKYYISETEYNKVMGKLIDQNQSKWNGYYILAILAALLSFLSQYLSELQNKVKKEKEVKVHDPSQSTMKIMKIMMPAMMAIFALTSTASFGIYLIASSLIGMLTSFISGLLAKKLTKKEEEKYLAFLEKEAIHMQKQIQKQKPQMVKYKKLGDRL